MYFNAKEVNAYLLKIKQGDKSQIGPLFEMTTLHLRNVAQFYLADKNSANDVVSETFVRIMKYINTYDIDQDGYNWMCKIAQNVAYDFNKKDARDAASERRFARDNDNSDDDDDLDRIEFLSVIDVLNDTDQFIAYKRFVEKETLEEIGLALNISKVAIHQRIKKIKKILYKNIKK